MTFTEVQKQQAIELFKKMSEKRTKQKEYMKQYRLKRLELGIKQKCYNKQENNNINCNNHYHKSNVIKAIKYLFKGDEKFYDYINI